MMDWDTWFDKFLAAYQRQAGWTVISGDFNEWHLRETYHLEGILPHIAADLEYLKET